MRSAWSPVERAIGLFAAIVLVMAVDALKPEPAPRVRVELTILSAEKKPDRSVDVTAEIANRGDYTLAGNRLLVVPAMSNGTFHTGGDGKNSGSGAASADDPPPDTPVRVLEGSFDEIPPNATVTVAFTVPPETAGPEPVCVVFQSLTLHRDNIGETRVHSVTEPLPIPD